MTDPKILRNGRMDIHPDTPPKPLPVPPITKAVREKLPSHGAEIERRVMDMVNRK